MENLAEVVQLGRGNALPLADAVNGAAADVVVELHICKCDALFLVAPAMDSAHLHICSQSILPMPYTARLPQGYSYSLFSPFSKSL